MLLQDSDAAQVMLLGRPRPAQCVIQPRQFIQGKAEPQVSGAEWLYLFQRLLRHAARSRVVAQVS